jgi:hypothetical protein
MISAGMLLWMSCTGASNDSGNKGDTGTENQKRGVSCTLEGGNGLRFNCTVNFSSAETTTLTVTGEDVETRTFVSPDATAHDILAWGLLPETTYTWSLAGETGTVTTGSVPQALADADVKVTGRSHGFDAILQPLSCGGVSYFAMFDVEGRVIWYQEIADYDRRGRGYDWAPKTRSLMVTLDSVFVEVDVGGNELLRLEQGVHFEHELHHDVSRWGAYTYLLLEYSEDGFNLDQVDVFEDTTLLGSWRLTDTYEVLENPSGGGDEWSHGNALNVSDAGEALFSSLSFDAIVAFDADPASPTFLEHLWLASGSVESLPNPDFIPSSGAARFQQQHAPHRIGDDLWLFDNASDTRSSRGLHLEMDVEAGQLNFIEEWPVDEVCRAAGGAYPLPGGGLVATCAPPGNIYGFRQGEPEPEWTLNAWCDGNDDSPIRFPKGIPITVE